MLRLFRVRVCSACLSFHVSRYRRRVLLALRAFQLCLALLCATSARPAAASNLVIEWTAPATCPDQAEILSRVQRALGDAPQVPLTATAQVAQSGDVFRAELRIRSSADYGERVLENTRCEILADSVALVIALSASRSAAARSDAQDNGPRFALSVHATAVAGPLPHMAFGGGVAVVLEGLAALRLELSGSYYAQQSVTLYPPGVGGDFKLLRFGARVCRIWTLGAFDLAPCLGAQLYRIEGVGFGNNVVTHSRHDLVWGPALGVFGRLRLLETFAIYVAADGVIAVSTRSFVVSGLSELHRASSFAFQLFVAPEVLF